MALALAIHVLPACVSMRAAPPFESPQAAAGRSAEEDRLWAASRRIDDALAASGAVDQDDELRQYLQSIVDRLYPEFAGHIAVRVLDAPTPNAFCLPNGSIYVHNGIIAAMDNEAQLASVLAHEAAHFTHRHGWRGVKSAKQLSATFRAIGYLDTPVVFDAAMLNVLVLSMYGHSRDMERQADGEGLQRLARAGYAPDEAAVSFVHLLAWVETNDLDEPPYLYSTHPRLQERIDELTRLARTGEIEQPEKLLGDGRQRDRYVAMTRGAYLRCIEDLLVRVAPRSAMLLMEGELDSGRLPAHASYYLAEAHRQRGDAGDRERAREALQTALRVAPHHAPTHVALGRLAWHDGDLAAARHHFERALTLEPNADAADMIRQTLDMLTEKEDER